MQLFSANLINFSNRYSNKSFNSVCCYIYCRMVTGQPLKEEAFYDVDLSR